MDLGHSLLERGSTGLLFAALLAAGVGAPLPEDLTLLVAGALVRRGVLPFGTALAVCFAGVVIGDFILFHVARRVGVAAARAAKIDASPRWARVDRLLSRHGAWIVFAARFVGGMRAATFGTAGARGMPFARFALVDVLAAALSVPLIVGLGYVFADELERVRSAIGRAQEGVLIAAACAAAAYLLFSGYRRRRPPRPAEPA